MTNEDILQTAMQQSAEDLGCSADDFRGLENVIVPFALGPDCKKYYKLPISCNMVSYGTNVVASANGDLYEVVREYISKFQFYHCFETPNMRWLNERIEPMGQTVCYIAEYYLPNLDLLTEKHCGYELRVLEKGQYEDLYVQEWANALCKDRKELDRIAVGAYDDGRLIGLAGCSADAKEMWQIGVDVLPEYRMQGVATAVTSKIALEILNRGKVPFYCTAWSNIRSVRNAIKCGFLPTWVEMTIKPSEIVDEINS